MHSTRRPSRRLTHPDRPTAIAALAAVLVATIALVACGTSGGDQGAGTTVPRTTSTTDQAGPKHQEDLARGETAGIASQLVPVPGYTYQDLSEEEIARMVDELQQAADRIDQPEFFRTSSFHSVMADDPTQNVSQTDEGGSEVGLLQLVEFTEPPPAGMDGAIARLGVSGMDEIDSFTVDGTEVAVFERPESVDSRYTLTWYRHGVQGAFDGAEREPLETWVRAYLAIPEHEPDEDDRLAAALLDLDGYAYVNYWDDEVNATVESVVDGRPSSAHSVTDRTGPLGGLWLVETDPMSDDDLMATAEQLAPGADASITTVAGTTVASAEQDGRTISAWERDGIMGILVSIVPERADAFLAAYLAA